MRFAHPEFLWLLATVPLMFLVLAIGYGNRKKKVKALGHLPQIQKLIANVSGTKRIFKSGFILLAFTCLIFAFARPQAGEKTTLAKKTGIDIVVALDFSKSMFARDAYPSRIERAKAELSRLIDALKGDRIGLVAFAGETLSFPLTSDYAALKVFWRDMTPLDMPVGGTAIGKAVVASTRLLKGVMNSSDKPRSQVILLLTDGEDHQSDPIAAAKDAAKLGIRIYSVGIGSRSGEIIPQVNEDGSIAGYIKKNGKPVTTRLADGPLREMAKLTSGKYFEMEPKKFGVEPILKELSSFKKTETEARLIRQYDEVYHWFLFPAFLLFLIEATLSERKRIRRGAA